MALLKVQSLSATVLMKWHLLNVQKRHLQATSVRMERPAITRWLTAWTQAHQTYRPILFPPLTITWVRLWVFLCLFSFQSVRLHSQTDVVIECLPSGKAVFDLTPFCKRKPGDERTFCFPCTVWAVKEPRYHSGHTDISDNIPCLSDQDGKHQGSWQQTPDDIVSDPKQLVSIHESRGQNVANDQNHRNFLKSVM